MKVSNDLINNSIVPQVRSHCKRSDETYFAPVRSAITNVFHYINKINSELIEGATLFEQNSLEDLMLPSGLAQFIEPVVVKLDCNNHNNPDLKAKFECSKEEKSLPDGYGYAKFVEDVSRICTAMNISVAEFNTSVAQKARPVDVQTVVDKLLIDGYVKYSGTAGTEFAPLELISGFTLGIDTTAYNNKVEDMIAKMFGLHTKEIFSK